jgi:NADPH:quinone reductase-like Zn-dependent oxidoreductase
VDLLDGPERIGTVAFQPAAAELGIRRLSTTRSSTQLAELVELYEAGILHVTVSRTYPLDQAAKAHRAIEAGHTRGKIALTP